MSLFQSGLPLCQWFIQPAGVLGAGGGGTGPSRNLGKKKGNDNPLTQLQKISFEGCNNSIDNVMCFAYKNEFLISETSRGSQPVRINRLVRGFHGYDQPTCEKGTAKTQEEGQHPRPSGGSSKEGGMCSGLYLYSQEAQFRPSQGGQGSAHQWNRGDHLYSWNGAQPAGTLRCSDPGGARQGPSWCTIPYRKRHHGHHWGR